MVSQNGYAVAARSRTSTTREDDTMVKPVDYVRAGSLQSGEEYMCQLSPYSDGSGEFTPVTFISYTSCPAFVLVQDVKMGRFRCNRMDLYGSSQDRKNDNSPPRTVTQAASPSSAQFSATFCNSHRN